MHLVDLAVWMLDFSETGRRDELAAARHAPSSTTPTRASSTTSSRLACSWVLHAGRDAVFEATFHGSDGGVGVRNVDGSFYDFRCDRCRGHRGRSDSSSRRTSGADGRRSTGRAGSPPAERFDAARGGRPVRVAEIVDRDLRAMKVLMTTDAVGGVWTYAPGARGRAGAPRASRCISRRWAAPAARQRGLAAAVVAGLHESDFALEWQDDPWDDVDARGRLAARAWRDDVRPDVVHLNGYAHARCRGTLRSLVVGHSCVVSW